MVNYQVRVYVTSKKKTLFERILSPTQAAEVDAQEVINGLKHLFPHESTICFEYYGV